MGSRRKSGQASAYAEAGVHDDGPQVQIVLRSGLPPVKALRNRWFENEELKALVRPPPTVEKLNVSIPMDDGRVRVRPRPAPTRSIKLP